MTDPVIENFTVTPDTGVVPLTVTATFTPELWTAPLINAAVNWGPSDSDTDVIDLSSWTGGPVTASHTYQGINTYFVEARVNYDVGPDDLFGRVVFAHTTVIVTGPPGQWREVLHPTNAHVGDNSFVPGDFYPDGGICAPRSDGTAWFVGGFGDDQFDVTPVVSYSPTADSWTSHPGIDMFDLTQSWATNSDMNPITAFEYNGDFYIVAMPGSTALHVYRYNGDGTITDVAAVDPTMTLWPGSPPYTVNWFDDYTKFPAAVVGSKAFWTTTIVQTATPFQKQNWLVSYNFTSNAWHAEAQLSTVQLQQSTTIFDGTRYIYVIGGFYWPGPNELTTEPNLTNGRVQRFDTQGGVGTSFVYVGTLQPGWISAENIENIGLEGVEGATGCYANGKLWILGGWYIKEANETGVENGYQPIAYSVDPTTLAVTSEGYLPFSNTTDGELPSGCYAGSAFADARGNVYYGLGWNGQSGAQAFDIGWFTNASLSAPNLAGALDSSTAFFWRPRA